MRITQSRSKAIKYGSKGSKSFGVNTQNSKFFRVMSDTLYTDKIGSIIRELASNAIDGQRAQGNLDTPFDIFLPCRQNPKFCIRDYGTGLSPEDIEGVYTRYFESTKDQNEDDIGGFGLGAKTPFAYTDSFIVRSYYNGQVFTYTIAFSGDEPEYELQFVQDTNEPNGLEVYFDVDPEDFREFATKAFQTLIWFDYVPNVWTGSEDENGFFKVASNYDNYRERIADFRKTTCYEDENMIVCPTSYSNPFEYRGSYLKSDICVIQGGVLYPVSEGASPSIREFVDKIPNNYTIITKHKIGEISLTPSREQIEESKQTIKNIEAKIKVILAKSQDTLRQTILDDVNSKFIITGTIQNLRQGNAYRKSVESLEDTLLIMARSEEKIATDTFKERFGEEMLEYKKRIENFKTLVPLFEGDKVSAYTKNAGYIKPKKVKDIAEMRFSANGFNKIHVVLRDSGISAQIQAVMKEINIQNNELVFVLDTYKKTLKDSKHEEKLDYLTELKDGIVKFLECSDDDIALTKESDIVTKARHNTNIRVYEKNTYAVFEKSFHSKDVGEASINSISGFLDKNVVYAVKNGHAQADVTITDKNGNELVYTCSRSGLAEIAHYAGMMFDMEYDSLIFVNKKELRDIQKHGSGTVTDFGKALENAIKSNIDQFENKVAAIGEITEKEHFIANFKTYKHLLGTFQMIGDSKTVKTLDQLIAQHSDELFSGTRFDPFEAITLNKHFDKQVVESTFREGYHRNLGNVWHYVKNTGFCNTIYSKIMIENESLKKRIDTKIDAVRNQQENNKYLHFSDFVNEKTFKEYPILKMVQKYDRFGVIEEDIAKDIESLIKMKISEKKREKVAA